MATNVDTIIVSDDETIVVSESGTVVVSEEDDGGGRAFWGGCERPAIPRVGISPFSPAWMPDARFADIQSSLAPGVLIDGLAIETALEAIVGDHAQVLRAGGLHAHGTMAAGKTQVALLFYASHFALCIFGFAPAVVRVKVYNSLRGYCPDEEAIAQATLRQSIKSEWPSVVDVQFADQPKASQQDTGTPADCGLLALRHASLFFFGNTGGWTRSRVRDLLATRRQEPSQ